MSKKLIIAFSALALAILAGAIAVVGVFAAQQQKVANTFTITYTANNVSAQVSGIFQHANGTHEYLDSEDTEILNPSGFLEEELLNFTPEQESSTKSYTGGMPDLTAEYNYVILQFVFYNTNSTGGKQMKVTVADGSVKTNVDVYYTWTSVAPEPDKVIKYGSTSVPAPKTIDPQGYARFSILIQIKDNTLDASYTTTADAGLHFTLNAVD